jgi:hypothetical protein
VVQSWREVTSGGTRAVRSIYSTNLGTSCFDQANLRKESIQSFFSFFGVGWDSVHWHIDQYSAYCTTSGWHTIVGQSVVWELISKPEVVSLHSPRISHDLTWGRIQSTEVEVTLRLAVSQSACLDIERSCRTYDQILLPVGMLLSEIWGPCGAPSLTRGQVCNLQCNRSMVRVAQNP